MLIGAHVDDKNFISGIRRELLKKVMMIICWCVIAVCGVFAKRTRLTVNDVDYSYYLGPDYRREASSTG